MDSQQLADYITNNYGTCKLKKCLCRDTHKPRFGGTWVGKQCPDWTPTLANTWEEFRLIFIERYSNPQTY